MSKASQLRVLKNVDAAFIKLMAANSGVKIPLDVASRCTSCGTKYSRTLQGGRCLKCGAMIPAGPLEEIVKEWIQYAGNRSGKVAAKPRRRAMKISDKKRAILGIGQMAALRGEVTYHATFEDAMKAMQTKDVVKAAGRLGLETSGRGEVWSIYAGDRFHKLAAPENLHEVLTWAADIMAEHRDADKKKAFLKLANVAEKWTE